RARRSRIHERAQLRPRVSARDRDDARRARRGRARRARALRARNHPALGRDDCRTLRLWQRRDDAPCLPSPPGRRPGGLSKPLPARPRRAGGCLTPPQETHPMDIAIPLYDRMTALDAVGPYEVLSRLPGARVRFVAKQPGGVTTETKMLTLIADEALE